MPPSPEFLLLAATLLDALPPSLPITDSLLLQLHLVFGPMLVSALQLVDKREVVRVTLPSDRHIYQVASSTGKNYTIHLNPPDPTPLPPHLLPDIIQDPPTSPWVSPTLSPEKAPDDNENDNGNDDVFPFRTPSPPPQLSPMPAPASALDSNTYFNSKKRKRKSPSELAKEKAELQRRDRVGRLARELGGMYCPCAGWAYGCLAGEKTVLCKHLLAVIIAHKTGKEVPAEVALPGVVSLLGLSA
ncbi:hypothetical protein IAT40_000307 [Kwoniella sp. CBS 6097]